MFTEEEARKAITQEAARELEKKIYLLIHKAAIEWVTLYNLPYRILFNYIKEGRADDEIRINPYYPLPGISDEYIWHYDTDGGYSQGEFFKVLLTPTGEVTEDGKPVYTMRPPDHIRKLQEEKAKPCRAWDLETEAGREKWLYYFAVFLLPYEKDMPNWNTFDFWGNTDHTEQETEASRQYYIDLITRCRKHPEIYKHTVATKGESKNDRSA